MLTLSRNSDAKSLHKHIKEYDELLTMAVTSVHNYKGGLGEYLKGNGAYVAADKILASG